MATKTLREQILEAQAALAKTLRLYAHQFNEFTRHHDECDMENGKYECTCGLTALEDDFAKYADDIETLGT